MLTGMKKNFERDGIIRPIAFFLHKFPVDEKFPEGVPPTPTIIPIDEYLNDVDWKKGLSYTMHKMCENPMLLAAGIIAEANYTMFNNNDELGKLILSGALKINELKNKNDIIMMIFGTPIEEEIFIYGVDIKNKTVGERYPETNEFGGLLTNLFGWNKN